jgi:hypothetical protein
MLRRNPLPLLVALLIAAPTALMAQEAEFASPDAEAKIKEAMSAAIPEISSNATIMDWDQTMLKEGSNGWTCLPTPPMIVEGTAPMCLDEQWVHWAHAWMTKGDVATEHVGIGYMLAGDEGASNIDPYAEGPTEDNDWVIAGPHLMVIVPNVADLEGMTTDHESGGPWVMWQGTPYAHIMVPVR